MKVNEAPERIYISNFDIEALPKNEQLSERWHEVSTQDTDIKYTRTDAFIEKALKWYCLDCECNDNCKNSKCFFYEQYERYLNGKTNAIPPKFSDRIINENGSVSEKYRYRHFINRMQDAFIEKAVDYIANNMQCNGYTMQTKAKFIKEFKKHMKGE